MASRVDRVHLHFCSRSPVWENRCHGRQGAPHHPAVRLFLALEEADFANDGTTRLSLGMTTERREKGKVIQVHQVRLSDSRRNTILHESRDQTKEQTLLRLLESMRSGI